MRTTAPPLLPPLGLHAELDALVEPLAVAYAERATLTARADQIEQDTADEAAEADIAAARAASLGQAAPATSKRAHALVADQLETTRDLANNGTLITRLTIALDAALTSHGRVWADEVETNALHRRVEAFTNAVDAVAAADLDLQAGRVLIGYLRHGDPLTKILPGRCWTLMRPSGDATTMTEVLDGLRRYATQQAPGRPGRMPLPGRRSA